MAQRKLSGELFDPRRGGQAIRAQGVKFNRKAFEPARTNYFSVYLIESGRGTFWADAAEFRFGPGTLLFFVPYQYIRFAPAAAGGGKLIQFHANFLCVETFHAEVGCSGVLFNDPYGVPLVALEGAAQAEVKNLVERIRSEYTERELAYSEVMLAQLKVLLVVATRLKSAKAGSCGGEMAVRHPALAELRELIEQNYHTLHSPGDYARRLHMSAKTLGRIVREELGTTLTDLIRNRILMHAKWQLLHTLKPVKQIARELGFSDELYFSRLFRKATGYSPKFFREFETEIRGGSNLSMSSSHAPILASAASTDT